MLFNVETNPENEALRQRLQRVLQEDPPVSSQNLSDSNLQRIEALLLTPPYLFPTETDQDFKQELQHIAPYDELLIEQAEQKSLTQPHMWDEDSIVPNLLSICALARFQELHHSPLVEAYIGSIHLAFIDHGDQPLLKEGLDDIQWELDWDFGAICTMIEDLQTDIDVAEEHINWDENLDILSLKLKESLMPRQTWNSWIAQARNDISEFFLAITQPKQIVAFAASDLPSPKPLPALILWRGETTELSLTYHEDQPFLQFYGMESPSILMGGEALSATAVPESLATEKLFWWELPTSFSPSVTMKFDDREVFVSLVSLEH